MKFTIAKTWNQHRYLTMDEGNLRMWHMHTMEYYIAVRNDEIMQFAAMWMELEYIMLNEVSHKKKYKYRIIYLYVVFKITP